MDRRSFLKGSAATIAALSFGGDFWRQALSAPAQQGEGPYGPLAPADLNGIALPAGFSSKLIAVSGLPVFGTTYLWHAAPDGGATYATSDGGWIYVSNSEVPGGRGGAGAIRFDADGNIADAYRILEGTTTNCAGGSTPWGTWLSCEETGSGRVWECDPAGARPAIVHPAMGTFSHEAAVIDPATGIAYLTEDTGDSCFYRFRPTTPGDLSAGVLEAAIVGAGNPLAGPVSVSWGVVTDPSGVSTPTRNQVAGATRFRRGEGAWFDSGLAYFTTTGDHRVWVYDAAASTIEVLYDPAVHPGPLEDPDNIMVAPSGDIFVAEDAGDLGLEMITRERVSARFASFSGVIHAASEIAGPAFNPAGTKLYLSSQRAAGVGMTYEISGPFRS